jgi:hypothetical protein
MADSWYRKCESPPFNVQLLFPLDLQNCQQVHQLLQTVFDISSNISTFYIGFALHLRIELTLLEWIDPVLDSFDESFYSNISICEVLCESIQNKAELKTEPENLKLSG